MKRRSNDRRALMAGILALLGAVTFGALWFGLRIVRKVARVKR